MPELPDVEVYKRYLDARVLRRRVAAVHAESPELLHNTSAQGLGRIVNRKPFSASRRHGKYLFVRVADGPWLALHFGMTGWLKYLPADAEAPRHTRVLFLFDNGCRLAYVARRKLGGIDVTDEVAAFIADRSLGPDALGISLSEFRERLSHQSVMVKSTLMDQAIIAGIGNVYSDEILYHAGIHPRYKIGGIDNAGRARLHKIMLHVLRTAIKAGADPERMPDSWLLPHRSEGAPCPKCGGQVKQIRAAGRNACFCPRCQPPP